LLNTCPHHGFETWRLVSHFYEGLTPRDRQIVELMCNETFKDKDLDEVMECLDSLAENAQNWDTKGTYEAPSKTQPHTSSGGMYNLREDHDLQAKFASLARNVEALELKKSGQLKSVQDIVCQICETIEHSTNDCLTLPFLGNASMNKPMFQIVSKGPIITHTRKHTTLVGEITQILVGRVMHKLHSHSFKHTIISKILMDMHLLMLHLLEEILRKHCMHSLKSKRQSTLNLLKA